MNEQLVPHITTFFFLKLAQPAKEISQKNPWHLEIGQPFGLFFEVAVRLLDLASRQINFASRHASS